jgi:hypothetical protein
MTRILFVSLFTATLTITAFSQPQNQPENAPVCSLSLSQAPVIRGIRLGMKPDEWLKLFPGGAQDEKIKAILDQPPAYPEYGLKRIVFESSSSWGSWGGAFKILPKEEFSGIDRAYLTLFDNQIVQFQIFYSPVYSNGSRVPAWDDISQLITIFSETFNLPKISAWEKKDYQSAVLKCPGFELELSTSNNETKALLKSKSDIYQIIRQRGEIDKQKGRAAFKP